MGLLARLSFRQLALGAVVLIALLLSATAVHALLTLDRFAAQSREAALRAVVLTANAQRLDERGIAMQRSARQFAVLEDPVFRDRFADAWRDAGRALDVVAAAVPARAAGRVTQWKQASAQAWKALQQPSGGPVRAAALSTALAPLAAIQAQLASDVRLEVERRNVQLLDELEAGRSRLWWQVGLSIVLSAALAVGAGVWLSRPLKRIEAGIGQLGNNQLDGKIVVEGPRDLRHLGGQLDWLRGKLASVEADKQRFLRHVSHELKTPLAALREGVSLLEDGLGGTLSPRQREIVGILSQNALALQAQIEDLLRFNEASAELRHLHRAPADLAELVRQAVAAQRLQLEAAGVRAELTGGARPVAVDAGKVGVAIGNLLSNAIRHSPRGATIWLGISESRDAAVFDCIDSGSGVAPEDAPHLFEPFYQGERQPPGARRGNGIGLSLVAAYAQAHGGKVELVPSPRGAHFRMTLPYET
ncbi:MAG: sensor histidine kinase [Telluria sp.]